MGSCLTGDIFLRGQFIEVGIQNAASFGSTQNSPPVFVSAGKKLSFICDNDKNGMTAGDYSSYTGDYSVPGAPTEGWLLQWTSSNAVVNLRVMNGLNAQEPIVPNTFDVTSTAGVAQSALWVGTTSELFIAKTYSFDLSNSFVVVSVTLMNTAMSKVSYLFILLLLFSY